MKKALTLVSTLLLGSTLALALNPQPLPPGIKRVPKSTASTQTTKQNTKTAQSK